MNSLIIKPLAKGQVTIPVRFREALGIDENTLFRIEIKNEALFLQPLKLDWRANYLRDFSKEELSLFAKEDKIDKKTLAKLKKYL